MSYRTQAVMAQDNYLLLRITACAAGEGIDTPRRWAGERNWVFSAQPGWDASYAYAIATNVQDPGNSEVVITDGQILSAVQAVVNAEAE